jgi:outer membrane protein TolC
MALNDNHDLRAADKNIASSIELVKSAQADLKPKLSGDANFQYTGNPLKLNINLPQAEKPVTFGEESDRLQTSLLRILY